MPNITPEPLLDPNWRGRLGRILAQQDDTAEGAVIASALAARRFLEASGLRWRDILPVILPVEPPGITRAPPTSWRAKVALCQQHSNLLTERERDFIRNASGFSHLSPKQSVWLDGIVAKVRAA